MAKPLIAFFVFTTFVCGVKWYTASAACADAEKKLAEAGVQAKAERMGLTGITVATDGAGVKTVELSGDPLEENERAAFVLQAFQLEQARAENERLSALLARSENATDRAEAGRAEALRTLESTLRDRAALISERDDLKTQYVQLAREVLRYKEAEERRKNTTPALIVR